MTGKRDGPVRVGDRRASALLAGMLIMLALALGACGMRGFLVDASLTFDHDGYALTCDGVVRDPCVARADELASLIEGRNGTIVPTRVRIRPDERFLWCWQRRPDVSLVALVTGRRGSGCVTRLAWMQRP